MDLGKMATGSREQQEVGEDLDLGRSDGHEMQVQLLNHP
jgi:hypothetical protein